jgi:hypothetical protein
MHLTENGEWSINEVDIELGRGCRKRGGGGGRRWADTCSSGVRWVVRRGTVTGACCTVWVGLGVVIMKVINVLTRVIYEIDEIDECKSL